MFALSIDLLGGRYHASPWGTSANEGAVEWPPSPWRIARAMVDAWHRAPEQERPAAEIADDLLAAIAPPPRYILPRATVGQSAHYMPKPLDDDKTTLVFDAFVRTDGRPIIAVWDGLDLSAPLDQAARYLVDRLGYLGRAESAARWSVLDELPVGRPSWAEPDHPDRDPAAHEGWHHQRVLCLQPGAGVAELSVSTAQLRAQRRPGAPGGRHAVYLCHPELLAPAAARSVPAVNRTPRIEVLRFALDGPVRPAVADAIEVGRLFRRAALARMDERYPNDPDLLAQLRGRRSDDGDPESGHQHAHYLPTDEDGDGLLDHLTVWCPAGLHRGAVESLDMVRLTGHPLSRSLAVVRLAQVALGGRREASQAGRLCTASSVWRSATPFVPTRSPKRRASGVKHSYPDQVRLELRRRGLPDDVEVAPYQATRHWGAFAIQPRGAGRGRVDRPPWPPALGFELRFTEPVVGPIALGQHSHHGLGLFLPPRSKE